MKNLTPDSKKNKKVLIVAEVANAHQGSMEQAEKLVKAAGDADVDAVKFQMFTADELCSKTHSRYEHFKKLELSGEKIRRLSDAAHRNKLQFFCDAFGLQSADFLISLPAEGIKIHSSDLSNIHLLRCLAGWTGKIMLSCGGASELEIYRTITNLGASAQDLILLHGFQGFPTAIEETHLRRIDFLRKTFRLPVGFMDHIDAEDEMAFTLPLLSISAGVVLIEKHLTLDRSLKGIDYYSSLNPSEMKKFVQQVRCAEKALGSKHISFDSQERQYREKMKKHLVAARDISSGCVIKESDFTYVRTEDDSFPLSFDSVTGRKAKTDISKDEAIKLSHLSLKTGILIIARMNSSRLQGKALIPILNRPALSYLIERAKLCRSADAIVLCTTTNVEDDALVNLAVKEGISYYRGDTLDVLSRMLGGCKQEQLDIAVRVTGDDILLSPDHLDQAVRRLMDTNSDYCHNKGLPSGMECEVFTVKALKTISDFAEYPENTEYLTYYVSSENFNKTKLNVEPRFRSDISLTLDTREDLERITFLLENIYRKDSLFTQDELIDLINRYPDRFRKKGETKDYMQVRDSLNCDLNFGRRFDK